MRRNDNFVFRVSEVERAMIADLARYFQRSESDAVRLLIREAVHELGAQNQMAHEATRRVLSNASAN